ncbi:hypothetical protein F2Q65_04555 [Thiohalocapsa marina]|uniref:Uncharacterized protein n=1 Tax=Thiohalocapsa marina TaxID=424902 RepID=A0A5M8FPE9_9GAMM|nr:hypothetical protein [Thiohalocapsa marina]KAA6186649.1 hypothetical protein F2Q65_04555 [Thiohalocapsa marina]
MRYYLGVVCLLFGAFLIYRAIDHRRRVLKARALAASDGPNGAADGESNIDPSLLRMRTAMLPFYAMYGAFASLLLVGGYFLSDLSEHLSLLDLFGLVVLAIAYSVFMVMRAAYSRLGLDLSRL